MTSMLLNKGVFLSLKRTAKAEKAIKRNCQAFPQIVFYFYVRNGIADSFSEYRTVQLLLR